MSQTAPTYEERRAWNHGTVTERLGKDAVPSFDHCNLTLRVAVDPVVTPSGVLYSREAILESLLLQKKVNKDREVAYKRYLAEKELKKGRFRERETDVEVLATYSKQMGASDAAIDRLRDNARHEYEQEESGKQLVSSVKNIKSEAKKISTLKSYWVAGLEQAHGKSGPGLVVEKPDTRTRCPTTRQPLKLKDVVTVRFQKNNDGECIDPVTLKAFTNASKLIVLKDVQEGPNVLSRSTYERVVEPEGQFNGTTIDKETGVISLRSGGTGFAATNKLEASKHFAVGSTLHRGRAAGRSGASSGLRFAN